MKQMPEIEFPCPESISEMTPVAGGHHCKSCDQKIYDVTDMSESQIEALKQYEPNLCVSYEELEDEVAPKLFSIRKFALAVLVVFGTGMFSFTNAQLHDEIGNVKTAILSPEEASDSTTTVELSILVMYRNKHSISASVDVVLPNGKVIMSHKKHGAHVLKIPTYCIGKQLTINVSNDGKTKSKKLLIQKENRQVEFTYYGKSHGRRMVQGRF